MPDAVELRSWLRADFGVDATLVEPVGHGADAAATVWRMTDAGVGRRAVE